MDRVGVLTAPDETTKAEYLQTVPSIFLAGGITNCPLWQDLAVASLSDMFYVFNPRRVDWPDDPGEISKQIEWEHRHLLLADAHLFWFPASESVQPIALYELGKVQSMDRPLFVGADLAYKRRQDIEIQLPLVRPDVILHDRLTDLIQDVVENL